MSYPLYLNKVLGSEKKKKNWYHTNLLDGIGSRSLITKHIRQDNAPPRACKVSSLSNTFTTKVKTLYRTLPVTLINLTASGGTREVRTVVYSGPSGAASSARWPGSCLDRLYLTAQRSTCGRANHYLPASALLLPEPRRGGYRRKCSNRGAVTQTWGQTKPVPTDDQCRPHAHSGATPVCEH